MEQLQTIQVPCLVLWGSKDRVAPLDSGRLLEERISGAELKIFEDAGHPCYLDQPDLWHEELLAFLDKNFS
jgi:abhydrolase domain-containing protein 14